MGINWKNLLKQFMVSKFVLITLVMAVVIHAPIIVSAVMFGWAGFFISFVVSTVGSFVLMYTEWYQNYCNEVTEFVLKHGFPEGFQNK